jgi:hypothetical protein
MGHCKLQGSVCPRTGLGRTPNRAMRLPNTSVPIYYWSCPDTPDLTAPDRLLTTTRPAA